MLQLCLDALSILSQWYRVVKTSPTARKLSWSKICMEPIAGSVLSFLSIISLRLICLSLQFLKKFVPFFC